MHKTSFIVALTMVGLAASARAQEIAPDARQPRREVSVSLLPMGLGKFSASLGGMNSTDDAAFSYGFGLHAGYAIIPGLTLGLAPQVFFNVKPKVQDSAGAQELDVMVRAAYSRHIVESIALFVEVLPGYSIIHPSPGDSSTGLVLGFGGGTTMDLSEHAFASFGLGYQVGFQSLPAKDAGGETRTRYLRVAIGVGTRF
jgi:Outer membrane protein beta-barrel domain